MDAVYFDFKKVFDLVDSDVLLRKLWSVGFGIQLLSFMANYFRDHKQYVKLGNHRSQEYYTRLGISQSSILGPTIFLIMIDDLPAVLFEAECLMFTDDLKLFLHSTGDCKVFQNNIDAVVIWGVQNKLSLNTSERKTITFTRSHSLIITTYEL